MSFFDRFKKKDKKKKDVPSKRETSVAKEAPAATGADPNDLTGVVFPLVPPQNLGETSAQIYPTADIPLLPGAPKNGKINIALYWCAACGGCDVSILDSNETVLTIGDMANIVMWPIAVDGKEKDIEAMDDGSITVSLINGAIRNSENEHMAKLLRKKSALVVSYGTCAMFGGTPALANLTPGKDAILDYVYTKTPTSANFQKDYGHEDTPIIPQTSFQAPEGELTLPVLYNTVKALDQVIDVDYYIPGCPPQQESISQLLKAVVDFVYNGVALPPKGTEIGVSKTCMCDECPREKNYERITKIVEPYQIDVDPNKCLMDQGILCLGPATVGGCNARCPRVGQPCRGCNGPTGLVTEHGASALTAIASLFPILDEDPVIDEERIITIMEQIKDPLGYFYAFTLSKSLINRTVEEN